MHDFSGFHVYLFFALLLTIQSIESTMKSFQFIEHEFEGVAHSPVWLEVGRFMAEDDLKRLCQWIPELHGIDRMVDAERDSKHTRHWINLYAQEKSAQGLHHPVTQLDVVDNELWFSWFSWAKRGDAHFKSVDHFCTFCGMAGIDSESPIQWSGTCYWASHDKKILFVCCFDPREGKCVKEDLLVCFGERSRSKLLSDWFFQNGN